MQNKEIFLINLCQKWQTRGETLLNISTEQMGYITNVDAGCDLVKYGNSLVPFVNRFPTNIRLYELMTAKPGEDSVNREECKIILFSDVEKMGL